MAMTKKSATAAKATEAAMPLYGWRVILDMASRRAGADTSDYVKIVAASGDKVLVALRPTEAQRLFETLRDAGAFAG